MIQLNINVIYNKWTVQHIILIYNLNVILDIDTCISIVTRWTNAKLQLPKEFISLSSICTSIWILGDFTHLALVQMDHESNALCNIFIDIIVIASFRRLSHSIITIW